MFFSEPAQFTTCNAEHDKNDNSYHLSYLSEDNQQTRLKMSRFSCEL